MDYNRINKFTAICAVRIFFSGNFPLLTLSNGVAQDGNRFFQSEPTLSSVFKTAYHGKSSFRFTESGKETAAGVVYSQQIIMRYPSMDADRSRRNLSFHSVRFVEMQLTDGTVLIMGRNDIQQNTKIKVETSSDLNLTQVKMSSESIQPVLIKFVRPGEALNYTYDFIYNNFVFT